MALNAKNAQTEAGKAVPPIEPGTYVARLVRVVDLGLQKNPFDSEKRANEINVSFELMDEYLNDDPQLPRMLSDFVKLYRGANRGKNVEFLSGLDPANKYDGDWAALCRDHVPCLLNVSKKEKNGVFRNQIESISPVLKGLNPREPICDSYVFDLDNPDRAVWEKLSDWVKEKIQERITDEEPVKYERTEADARGSAEVSAPEDEPEFSGESPPFDDGGVEPTTEASDGHGPDGDPERAVKEDDVPW